MASSSRLALIRHEFELSLDVFKGIVQGFRDDCEQGLRTVSVSGLATMISSYVTRLPTGEETGTFLALDLGGSTLRACAVDLLGNGQVNVTEVRRLIDILFELVKERISLIGSLIRSPNSYSN